MLIGNRNSFGVQFYRDETQPGKMGYGKIWINGKFIGVQEDLIYLESYLGNTIKHILNSSPLDIDLTELSSEELYSCISNKSEFQYRIPSTTFIDDFEIFSFLNNNKIAFLWKYFGNRSFHELQNYPTELQFEVIDKEIIKYTCQKALSEI